MICKWNSPMMWKIMLGIRRFWLHCWHHRHVLTHRYVSCAEPHLGAGVWALLSSHGSPLLTSALVGSIWSHTLCVLSYLQASRERGQLWIWTGGCNQGLLKYWRGESKTWGFIEFPLPVSCTTKECVTQSMSKSWLQSYPATTFAP